MPYSVLHDELLLRSLHWDELEDVHLLPVEPRRDLRNHGLLNLDAMDSTLFYRSFRFEKSDLDDLLTGLLIPEEVESAQRVRVPGREALCMTLRRLACPSLLCDLEVFFSRHSSVISSVVSKVLSHIEYYFGHLLADLTEHRWLNLQNLKLFSQAIHRKGAPLKNCWGFVDGTARRICRPSVGQQDHFSGHKRHHVQKYQAVMCPNGLICQMDGPFHGRRHDAGILKKTALYRNLEKVAQGHEYVIYGDPAYPLRPLLLKPFGGASLQPYEAHFNKRMSTVRQAVEWGFGNVAADFAFVDFHENQRMTQQRVGRMYKVATLLSKCRTYMYGSQVSTYFGIAPPSFRGYLVPSE
ncbi:uncharacterized protein LOC142563397 [Dermacentor variabilis]|uniref:uncharacterized protein LOC142563397 n=1 Tax=Dermacentor variabilis TaxID=34621 RepID=UPI003F5C4DBF